MSDAAVERDPAREYSYWFDNDVLATSVGRVEIQPRDPPEDYGYRFEDDPLAAGGFGPTEPRIHVLTGPARAMLIRPRTSFVVEMLTSVEKI